MPDIDRSDCEFHLGAQPPIPFRSVNTYVRVGLASLGIASSLGYSVGFIALCDMYPSVLKFIAIDRLRVSFQWRQFAPQKILTLLD